MSSFYESVETEERIINENTTSSPHNTCNDASTSEEQTSLPTDSVDNNFNKPSCDIDNSEMISDFATMSNIKSSIANDPSTKVMSKKQIKKRRRWEKAMERKRQKKEHAKKVKLAKATAMGRDIEKEQKEQKERENSGEGHLKRELAWIQKIQASGIHETFQVCIDCSFDDIMTFKESNSLASQIRYAYATNRRSANPVFLTITGMNESSATYLQMKKVNGFPDQWKTRAFELKSEPLEVVYPKGARSDKTVKDCMLESDKDGTNSNAYNYEANKKKKEKNLENLVYLTSDSSNELKCLDNDKVYIIGGIVDRNRFKGLTLKKATELGITTARLPIEQYMKLVATKVLTVNHVFDILLKYRTHHSDWKSALLDVLPARKDITILNHGNKDNQNNADSV